MSRRFSLTAVAAFALSGTFVGAPLAAQRTIPLYDGPAKGSENWNYEEQRYFAKAWGVEVVSNVTKPTLTVFLPAPGTANGTAAVICPGGAFYALSIASEGEDVARWLAARGVASFVLKYRLVHTGADGAAESNDDLHGDRAVFAQKVTPVIPLAIADGRAAVAWVRAHAADFGVSAERVGIIGFSAGGTVSTAVALDHAPASRPAFVASIYAWTDPAGPLPVPADAAPLFVAAASDDGLDLQPQSVALYSKWLAARKPVELHMYAAGNHGFGMRTQHIPTDTWIERFGDWLGQQGFLKK